MATVNALMPAHPSRPDRGAMQRTTRDGRQLTYEMQVIQQPERARACGSGVKCTDLLPLHKIPGLTWWIASADRRPVDPPPVVQLTIYEEHNGERIDITATYQASFFLFTTLENARNINHGRVAINNTFPALTGMPCAGMAYLERPTPGGYFIFPDLSVRHEGKYLLSFNLYEETKNLFDEDMESSGSNIPTPSPVTSSNPAMQTQKHMNFRLEMQSKPFQVYSAKKFPGLAESTILSRVVAEQGCRVRIRRDVRMRRRETGKDFGDYEEEHQHIRPDNQYPPYGPERPRSVSNGSVHSAITASVAAYPQGRRPSQDTTYVDQSRYQTPQPTMPATVNSTPYTDHLAFGGSQYGPTTFQPPPAPISRSFNQYQSASNVHYTSPTHMRHMSNPQDYTYQAPMPQQSSYQTLSRHSSASDLGAMHQGQTATSQQMYQAQPQMSPYFDQQYSMVNHDHYGSSYPTSSSQVPPPASNGLPPVTTMPYPPEPKSESVPQGISLSAGTTPQQYDGPTSGFPFPSSSHTVYSTQTTAGGQNPYMSDVVSPTQTRTRKRALDQVFDTTAIQQPMQNGMRPSVDQAGQDFARIEGADGIDEYPDLSTLKYKRADGRQQVKKAPSPVAD